MKIVVKRHALKNTHTIGRMYIDGVYICDTLEPPVRDLGKNGQGKVYGHTAIPEGEYNIDITFSFTFKRELPILRNVPFFSGIRIHRGNVVSHTKGCILVGENKRVGEVWNSTTYEKKIIDLINNAGGKATISIINS